MCDSYDIHDNGGRPFSVEVSPAEDDRFKVTVRGGHSHPRPGSLILTLSAVEVFVPPGEHNSTEGAHVVPFPDGEGNTLLTCTEKHQHGLTYVWIGESVFCFTLSEPVTLFRSIVGNSNVPYPYAMTDSATHLLLERVSIPGRVHEADHNAPYRDYYREKTQGTPLPHVVLVSRVI